MRRFAKHLLVALPFVSMLALCAPHEARAFCGFYVGGAGTKLFNDATQVVLMREGTRTVLSMQNDYKGTWRQRAVIGRRLINFTRGCKFLPASWLACAIWAIWNSCAEIWIKLYSFISAVRR